MLRNLILSGGVAHDFPASSARLAEVLDESGFDSSIREDVEAALTELVGFDLVTVNLLRWRMDDVERYADQRERWGISLSASARAGLLAFVHGGGGLLAMHGAPICFDDWPEWGELIGGRWVWGTSSHPPLDDPIEVTVHVDAHPVVAGSADFSILDEAYGFLHRSPDVRGLLYAHHGGAGHPLAWALHRGAGRVVYDALGHHPASYEPEEHRRIVRRAALWAATGSAELG